MSMHVLHNTPIKLYCVLRDIGSTLFSKSREECGNADGYIVCK